MPKLPSVARVGTSQFTFDPRAQRYRLPNGRFMAPKAVRAIIDDDIEATGERMAAIGERLKSGQMDLETFREQMAREIKALHLAEVATARGGFSRMNQESYGRAGERVRFHYEALNGLVSDLQEFPELLTDEGAPGKMDFLERVTMYAEAGRNTYERARLVEMKAAGFGSMENEEEAGAHHCQGDNSCPSMTKLGRVALDDNRFRMPGDRRCVTKCKCNVNYFKAALVTQ